jgi:ATP/maltotriose-dependent transcriptional regulator MalT/DNA-binding SARP family transcriptional activator
MHRKLTFVSAPAGYGKTTLLVDFASDVDAEVCWYRIGTDDSDLVQFVRHIVAAFQQQFPNFGKKLDEQLATPRGRADPPSLAVELINEVQLQVPDFTLLILDDYHLAGENQQIVDFIESMLENLPDHLRILMGSRSVYGIPTANLYIRDELITIGADELRFRADELQKLVLRSYRMRLSDEQANEFAKRADGWIIAILLAIRTMEGGTLPKFPGAIEHVYDYLAEEVISRQPDELREFMLATSILGDFTQELCNAVLDRKDSAFLLRALEERNLFVSRTETIGGNSYRYHQLFGEFLQSYFNRHDRKRKLALHERTAEWHRVHEEWESAITHKMAAGAKQEAAEWINAVAGQFYAFDRQVLLGRWLEQLERPPDMRSHAPHLLLYQAKTLGNQSNFDGCLALLDIAEPRLNVEGDTEALANAVITRGMVHRFIGQHEEAVLLGQKAQELLKGNKREAAIRQWHQAERLMAIPIFYTGKQDQAIQLLNSAVEGFRSLSSSGGDDLTVYQYDLAECLNDLGLVCISTGNMLGAQKAYQETLEIHKAIRSNLGALASARNNIGYLHHQLGEYAQAWKEYSTALDDARAAGRVRVQIGIMNGIAALLIDLEELDEARKYLNDALNLGSRAGEAQELTPVYLSLAALERKDGQFPQALNWLRKSVGNLQSTIGFADYSVELGNIYLAMGQHGLALEQYETTIKSLKVSENPSQSHVLALFNTARTLFYLERRPEVSKYVERSMENAAKLGYDHFLVSAAYRAQEFLDYIEQANPSAQLEDFVARAIEFQPDKGLLEPEIIDEKVPDLYIQVQALGDVKIRRNGELLPATIWRSNRARALFFYILLHKRVRKESIGLDFWPDFSAGKVSSNFHATLWRVRQALGFRDSVIFEEEQYRLHPSIKVWFDVDEFQNYIRLAQNGKLTSASRAELLRQAVQLYQGPYLLDVYMDWADKFRDEMRNAYLESLASLAGLESKSKRYGESRRLYEKIVAVDPYRDEIHLELMKCLNLLGSPSAALAHFKQYKALLRRELNAEPLPELQAYYEQLAVKA